MNKCFKWSHNDQYATPKNIYNKIIDKGFVDFNPLCENYDNSLVKDFDCNLYCNPPYSNIEPFVDYMLSHIEKGYDVIMLLPVRSGTKWFKKIMLNCYCVVGFFTQRLHFNESKSAPFDCMLVYISKKNLSYINKARFVFIDRDLKVVV